MLYALMRLLEPRCIIEVGSGFSSVVMLEVADRFNLGVELTFIEPYPKRLFRLLGEHDQERCRILERHVQDVALEEYAQLSTVTQILMDVICVSLPESSVLAFAIHQN